MRIELNSGRVFQLRTGSRRALTPLSAGFLQRAAVHRSPVAEVSAIVDAALDSPGQPLDAATRDTMEPRLGHDFSQVRVHTDSIAAESAQSINAAAYTVGRDVVFGAGRYAPHTLAGQQLIAHELVHVAQQQSGAPLEIQRQPLPADEAAVREYQQERQHFLQEQAAFQLEKVRTHVIQWSMALARWLQAYRSAGTDERREIQETIRVVERGLAESLEQKVEALNRASTAARPGAYSPAEIQRELNESRSDLEQLRRIFSPQRREEFEAMYSDENLRGLHCMSAAYQGMGALFGQAEAATIKSEVERKAAAYQKRTRSKRRPKGIDINQFITVLNTVRNRGRAGSKVASHYNSRTRRWTPRLQEMLLKQINPNLPGYYFFGLSLADAYHSVILGVDTWEGSPKIYWYDQIDPLTEVSNVDEEVNTRINRWNISYRISETAIWPLYAPAEAGIYGEE
jgi:hypothetical protein